MDASDSLVIWGISFIVWIAFSFVVAGMAKARGRSAPSWAIVALVSSPVLAWLILLVLTPAAPASTGPTKKCPKCAETVKAEAEICRFCQHSFVPKALADYRDKRKN